MSYFAAFQMFLDLEQLESWTIWTHYEIQIDKFVPQKHKERSPGRSLSLDSHHIFIFYVVLPNHPARTSKLL